GHPGVPHRGGRDHRVTLAAPEPYRPRGSIRAWSRLAGVMAETCRRLRPRRLRCEKGHSLSRGGTDMKRIAVLLVLLAAGSVARAEGPGKQLNVPYGKHPRQVLDFYPAKSDKPTPVVFYIHGGGWQGGDKKGFNPKPFLDKGISVVAINYRYVKQAIDDKVEPPVKAPLEDAARALQFVRSKAAEWNLDKKRIGATGGSAGGC